METDVIFLAVVSEGDAVTELLLTERIISVFFPVARLGYENFVYEKRFIKV